jgi:hypothetical protein
LSALDVVVVVLVVHRRQHCWYEDGSMYLPTWPADVTRRCRPRPRPRRDCCSACPLRHLLRAEKTGFKKHLHGRSMWGEGGGQIPPRKYQQANLFPSPAFAQSSPRIWRFFRAPQGGNLTNSIII